MPDTLKFTDDEINEIRFLQNKFQDKLIKFGQIQLEIIELEDRLTALKNEQLRLKNDYLSLQKTEQELMDKLTNKYGEGSLNLKEGTFTPSLAADTNTSYQHVLYQNSTFKLAASGSIVGGSSLVSRQENISVDTKAVVSGFGTQSDLNNATITFTGGNTLTVSNLNAFKLQQITVIYNSNVNSTSQFNFVYPEPNGQTSSTYTQYPIVSYWNNASPSVIQSNTNWNVSNSSGILTVQKTGLVSNTAAVFKIIV